MSNQHDPVIITKNSCLDIDLIYKDADENTEDISSDTFTVESAMPAIAFADAELSKTDPVNGVLHLHLDARDPETLYLGNTNWVRVARVSLNGCVNMSEPIWIEVT